MSSFFGCNSSNKNIQSTSKELVIYSGRKEPLFIPVVTKFEEKTGIKVILQSGETPALANAILNVPYRLEEFKIYRAHFVFIKYE
jgi:hypothetical protein